MSERHRAVYGKGSRRRPNPVAMFFRRGLWKKPFRKFEEFRTRSSWHRVFVVEVVLNIVLGLVLLYLTF